MPRAIGANCRLLTFPESTYGTAPGGNWRRMPFLSCDLGAEQPLLDADVIGVGSNRDPAAPFMDTVTVAGQAVVPVDLINIGHWLRLLLGAPVTTGSTNFVHTFGSGVRDRVEEAFELPCDLGRGNVLRLADHAGDVRRPGRATHTGLGDRTAWKGVGDYR